MEVIQRLIKFLDVAIDLESTGEIEDLVVDWQPSRIGVFQLDLIETGATTIGRASIGSLTSTPANLAVPSYCSRQFARRKECPAYTRYPGVP